MIDALSLFEISQENRQKMLNTKKKTLESNLTLMAKKGGTEMYIKSDEIEEEIIQELEDKGFEVIKAVNNSTWDYLIQWNYK